MDPRPIYRGLFGRFARRRCPHSLIESIHGDEVNTVGGWRLRCHGCRRYLDGPAVLAGARVRECALWVSAASNT